jgi:hypothetical protein
MVILVQCFYTGLLIKFSQLHFKHANELFSSRWVRDWPCAKSYTVPAGRERIWLWPFSSRRVGHKSCTKLDMPGRQCSGTSWHAADLVATSTARLMKGNSDTGPNGFSSQCEQECHAASRADRLSYDGLCPLWTSAASSDVSKTPKYLRQRQF